MMENGPIVEIRDYVIASEKAGCGLQGCSLAIEAGQVLALEPVDPADGLLLLRALATLEIPERGAYFFMGQRQKLADYRALLECKRRIGYIARDAALISNLSLRENLLLMRWYFGNSFDLELEDDELELCRQLDLERKMELRPSDLDPADVQFALVVRELSKKPNVILMDRPEDLVADRRFQVLRRELKKYILKQVPLVFTACEHDFFRRLSNRRLILAEGRLREPLHRGQPLLQGN